MYAFNNPGHPEQRKGGRLKESAGRLKESGGRLKESDGRIKESRGRLKDNFTWLWQGLLDKKCLNSGRTMKCLKVCILNSLIFK